MEDIDSAVQARKKRLTMQDRFDILQCLSLGHTGSSLAKKYGVSRTAISKIKINKENILATSEKAMTRNPEFLMKSKVARKQSHLDDALYSWFLQKKDRGEPVSGPMLKAKALQLNATLQGSTSFKASDGFLSCFKKRNGIRHLPVKKEELCADKNNQILYTDDDDADDIYDVDDQDEIYMSEDENETDHSIPSAEDALRLCDKFLTWFQTRWEFSSDDLENMLSYREITARLANKEKIPN